MFKLHVLQTSFQNYCIPNEVVIDFSIKFTGGQRFNLCMKKMIIDDPKIEGNRTGDETERGPCSEFLSTQKCR